MTSYPSDPAGNNAAQGGSYPAATEGGPPHAGAEGGGFYHARLEQPEPNLDANVPQLRAGTSRRWNRQALFWVGLMIVVVVGAMTWMFNSLLPRSGPSKAREEVVNVPSAPTPPPPSATAPTPQPQPQAQPIAVTPLPTPRQTPQAAPIPQGPRGPTLMERRMMDNSNAAVGVNGSNIPNTGVLAALQQQQQLQQLQQQQQLAGMAGMAGQPGGGGAEPGQGAGPSVPKEYAIPTNGAYNAPTLAKTSSAQPLVHPDVMMTRGTYIRCVLETHIITDVPGFTSCIVTEPVYSFTGKRMLLPKGSKVLGSYATEPNGPRVAVVWDRIITPTGIDVNMASPSVDNLGGAGSPGYLDEHWGERIGAALLISMLSDAFSYEAARLGPKTTTADSGMLSQSPFQSNTAQTLQKFAELAVRRKANRPATVSINQGTVVYVYVAKDVDFSGVVSQF